MHFTHWALHLIKCKHPCHEYTQTQCIYVRLLKKGFFQWIVKLYYKHLILLYANFFGRVIKSRESLVHNNEKTKQKYKLKALLQEGGRFQGPRVGSCLTLRNEFSRRHTFDKARYVLGKGTWAGSSRVRESRKAALPHSLQSWALW